MERTINYKKVILDLNKEVEVFDSVFPLSFRNDAYQFFKNSYFKIGWYDSETPELKPFDHYLHSSYSLADIDRLGILKYINNNDILSNKLSDYNLEKAILNLSNMSDVNFPHTHPEDKVLLYYGNLDWPIGSHGETLFYSEDLKEVKYCSVYTPGRLILFDGSIPHSIRPQSLRAPKYRFTLAMIFNHKQKGINNE